MLLFISSKGNVIVMPVGNKSNQHYYQPCYQGITYRTGLWQYL